MRLEFGDATFAGNGEHGDCTVGIERKKLSDLINSLKTDRLPWQLRNCRDLYDYTFLVTEMMIKPGPGGEIMEWGYDYEQKKKGWVPFYRKHAVKEERKSISYRSLIGQLTTLELQYGVYWRRTRDVTETASQYAGLWHWFNDKLWHEHSTGKKIYAPGPTPTPKKGHGGNWGREHGHDKEFTPSRSGRVGQLIATDPTTLWRMAAQLPGIDRTSEKVAEHFKTVRNMVLAGLDPEIKSLVEDWFETNPGAAEKAWMQVVDGKIGKVKAAAAVRAITEEGA